MSISGKGKAPFKSSLIKNHDALRRKLTSNNADMSIIMNDFFWGTSTPPPVTGSLKRWNGSTWITAVLKRWNGSSWVSATIKRWNGSTWVTV